MKDSIIKTENFSDLSQIKQEEIIKNAYTLDFTSDIFDYCINISKLT